MSVNFDYVCLLEAIRAKYKTQDAFAAAMGISRTSLNLKVNNRSEWSQTEILRAGSLLDLNKKRRCKLIFLLPKFRKLNSKGAL